jgi:hypothetical protein
MLAGLVAQNARANDFCQRSVLANEFQPKVNFDGFALGQAEFSRFFNVAGDLAWQ